MAGDDVALEMHERVVEERDAVLTAGVADAVEPVRLGIGESTRERFLRRRKHADADVLGAHHETMHRRFMTDTDEHHRRLEAQGAERTHCHSVIPPLRVARRDDRDARGKSAEGGPERVRINHRAELGARTGSTKSEAR